MKPKKLEKKLTLNKRTIANLKNDEMKKLQGGEGYFWKSIQLTACTCPGTACCSPTC